MERKVLHNMSDQTNIANTLPKSKPDLKLVFQQITREIMNSLSVAQSATIVKFYPATQTADVQPNIAQVIQYLTDANGNPQPNYGPYPIFPAVPVVCLGGGGGAITFPITAGDQCMLTFIDKNIDAWWLSGTQGLPPNNARQHDLSDAVAIIGLRSQNKSLFSYSTTDTQVYGSSGPSGPLVSLGTDKVGISNASMTLLTAMNDLVSALIALNAKTGPSALTQITQFQSDITALLK